MVVMVARLMVEQYQVDLVAHQARSTEAMVMPEQSSAQVMVAVLEREEGTESRPPLTATEAAPLLMAEVAAVAAVADQALER